MTIAVPPSGVGSGETTGVTTAVVGEGAVCAIFGFFPFRSIACQISQPAAIIKSAASADPTTSAGDLVKTGGTDATTRRQRFSVLAGAGGCRYSRSSPGITWVLNARKSSTATAHCSQPVK